MAIMSAEEPSDEIRANLLRVFKYIDYPNDLDDLIDYTNSSNEKLRNTALDALERLKDQRVHHLAAALIECGRLEDGLPLLVRNWRKYDEALIRKQLFRSTKVSHDVQINLQRIYWNHRSNSCGDILEYVYKHGECAYCRWGIVDDMWKNRVLKDSILEECLYDSYDETRKLARRIKNFIKR